MVFSYKLALNLPALQHDPTIKFDNSTIIEDVENPPFSKAMIGCLIGCFDVLTIKFTAARRIGYYIIRIYLPCVLCTVVSWMAFWMDPAYIGDRSAIGITSLLTQIFLVGSINEAMPRVSYVNAADLFLIVSFSFTFLALVETAAVYRKAVSIGRIENGISSEEEKARSNFSHSSGAINFYSSSS